MFIIFLSEFPKYNCLQINETHPELALVELFHILLDEKFRILLDEKGLGYWEKFNIVQKTFNYANHKGLTEALEKFGVYILERLLPRHLGIIYLITSLSKM